MDMRDHAIETTSRQAARAMAQPNAGHINRKADRAMVMIREWAGRLAAQEAISAAEAMELILAGLTGPDAETYWAKLAEYHPVAHPDHPGRDEFRTSRPVILAKLEAASWAASRTVVPADPFAGLDEGQR